MKQCIKFIEYKNKNRAIELQSDVCRRLDFNSLDLRRLFQFQMYLRDDLDRKIEFSENITTREIRNLNEFQSIEEFGFTYTRLWAFTE